ncbi:hypothetical protein UP10_14340 [Bradyrhizobium sp. LTSPM299]|nr:hypothetical protein UP10_14340 [Bradyrhizobium sp. LTSPM299]
MVWTTELHPREIGKALGRTEVAIGLRRAMLVKRQPDYESMNADGATKSFFGRNEHRLLSIGSPSRATCWISDLGFVSVK